MNDVAVVTVNQECDKRDIVIRAMDYIHQKPCKGYSVILFTSDFHINASRCTLEGGQEI